MIDGEYLEEPPAQPHGGPDRFEQAAQAAEAADTGANPETAGAPQSEAQAMPGPNFDTMARAGVRGVFKCMARLLKDPNIALEEEQEEMLAAMGAPALAELHPIVLRMLEKLGASGFPATIAFAGSVALIAGPNLLLAWERFQERRNAARKPAQASRPVSTETEGYTVSRAS